MRYARQAAAPPDLVLKRLRGQRRGVEIALKFVTAGPAQEIPLRLVLDPLGDHVQAQRPAHLNDGIDDACIAGVGGQALDETAVDLEPLDREALQITEAGIAGAEVVDGHPQPQRSERLEPVQRLVGIAQQDALGQLQLQQRWGQTGRAQHTGDLLDKLCLLEL